MVIIHKEILLKSFYILAPCFEQCVETFFRIKENWWLFKRGSIPQTIYFWEKSPDDKNSPKKNKTKTLPIVFTSWLQKLTPFPKVQRIGNDYLPIITRLWIRMVGIRRLSKILFMCNGLSWQIKVLYCGRWSIRRQVLHSQTSIYHSLLSMIRTSHPESGVKTWERRLHTLPQAKGWLRRSVQIDCSLDVRT
jgi:hypothetical protein